MKRQKIIKCLKRCEEILKISFFIVVLLAFSSPSEALVSIFCILVHEGAHAAAFSALGGVGSFGTRRSGFIMKGKRLLSMKDELIVASAGVLVNYLFALVFYIIYRIGVPAFLNYSLISLLTGITNSLPLPSYDGEKILVLFGDAIGHYDLFQRIAKAVGISLCFTLVVLSLFFIEKFALGYWIFISFFITYLSSLFAFDNGYNY